MAIHSLGAAIEALQTAQRQCRTRPALVLELDRVLGRLADLRRALLRAAIPLEHEITVVGGPGGVRAQCVCSWVSPLQVARTDRDRAACWLHAEQAGAAHLGAAYEAGHLIRNEGPG